MIHASSRSCKPCSATAPSNPVAQPPVRGPSSTANSRLVRLTESSTVSRSNGRSVRRSITSALTPSPARICAVASASGTPLPTATIVRSCPARAIPARPRGMISCSGAGPLTEYSRLCSRKMTGLSSRIDALSRPLASAGEDGKAIFSPGMP